MEGFFLKISRYSGNVPFQFRSLKFLMSSELSMIFKSSSFKAIVTPVLKYSFDAPYDAKSDDDGSWMCLTLSILYRLRFLIAIGLSLLSSTYNGSRSAQAYCG